MIHDKYIRYPCPSQARIGDYVATKVAEPLPCASATRREVAR